MTCLTEFAVDLACLGIMPPANHYLAIEVGRANIGLTLADGDGHLSGHLDRGLGPSGGGDDPADWWRTIRTGVKDLLRRSRIGASCIRGIGLSSTLDHIVCVDSLGEACAPSFHLDPNELQPYNQQIEERCGVANLRNITGQRAEGGNLAAHLLWIRDHARRAYHDLDKALFSHDFLRFRLTGQCVMDPSSAARTRLYNVRQRMWSKQLCSRLQLEGQVLPPVQPGRQLGGRVSQQAAKETGLAAGTPVILGGSHLAASAVALGMEEPGSALIELGGTGSCLITTAEVVRDRASLLQTGCHCLADRWTLEGRDLITDHGITWLTREVTISELARSKRSRRPVLDVLAEYAAEIPPGAEGLFFIQPEDTQHRGGFVGLDYRHKHGHLIRAVLESGALDLHGLFQHLAELQVPVEQVMLTGPGASNNLWCQIVTDAIDLPTTAIVDNHLCALGTVLMTSAATGSTSLSEAIAGINLDKRTFQPRPAASRVYQERYPQRSALTSQVAEILGGGHTAP
jgi:xylulokinase